MENQSHENSSNYDKTERLVLDMRVNVTSTLSCRSKKGRYCADFRELERLEVEFLRRTVVKY